MLRSSGIERFQREPKISPVGEKEKTMALFNKVVAEDGTVSYVEVDLKTVELPDDHPVKQRLHETTEESKRRKEKIRKLSEAIAQSGDEDDEDEQEPTDEPAPNKPKQRQAKPEPVPAPAINPADVAAEAAKLVRGQISAEEKARQERAAALATIVKETGVSEDALPILDAIPDLVAARATAEFIAKRDNTFDQTPSGGNGQRDTAAILEKVSKKLGIPAPGAAK